MLIPLDIVISHWPAELAASGHARSRHARPVANSTTRNTCADAGLDKTRVRRIHSVEWMGTLKLLTPDSR